MSIQPAGAARHYATSESRVTFFPLSIKRRQHQTMLNALQPPPSTGSDGGHPKTLAVPSFDLPLIRTLGKAFYWHKLVE